MSKRKDFDSRLDKIERIVAPGRIFPVLYTEDNCALVASGFVPQCIAGNDRPRRLTKRDIVLFVSEAEWRL